MKKSKYNNLIKVVAMKDLYKVQICDLINLRINSRK